tara:strand:- start:14073 stop:14552 length:480 start_codon:yes stop_codon:yes gene_type:complete
MSLITQLVSDVRCDLECELEEISGNYDELCFNDLTEEYQVSAMKAVITKYAETYCPHHQDYRVDDDRNNEWTWAIVSQALDDIIDSSINNCFCQGYCREELDDLEDIEYELDNDSEDGIDVEIVQFPDGTALFRDVDTGVYYDDNQDVVEVDDKYGQLE